MRLSVLVLLLPFVLASAQAQPPATPGGIPSEPPLPSWVHASPPCTGQSAGQPRPVTPDAASPAGPVRFADPAAAEPQVLVDLDATGAPDLLSFHYDSFQGLIRFRYQPDPAGPAHPITLQFHALLEYRDLDLDGQMDPDEPVVREARVPSLLHFARTWEGDCGIRLQWIYLLDTDADSLQAIPEADRAQALQHAPRLTLRFTHLAARTYLDGATVVPERVKIDIGLDDYAFADASTRIAIQSTVTAQETLDRVGDRLTLPDGSVGYSWAPVAIADGNETAVQVDVTSLSGADHEVTFNYPQARHLLHDPELGLFDFVGKAVAGAREFARAHPGAMALGASLSVAALLVLGLAMRRWP